METMRGPADTRSMGIVHSALRRDLKRTRIALETEPYPAGNRRRALAAHVRWMMHFLRMHHTAEDVGLWPLVRARNPSAGAMLDRMDADHKLIEPSIATVERAAQQYGGDGSARPRLLVALSGLDAVLLPHLEREELEMMPIVRATITDAEYLAVEREHFVKPKGFRELGAEAPWIIDGVTPADREVIVGVVPAVPRFVLLHGFGPRYRRKAALLWGEGPAAAVRSLSLSAATPE